MSLKDFSKRTEGSSNSPTPPPKSPKRSSQPVQVLDPEHLPAGYDPDIWHLACVFHAEAEEYERMYHRFVVYSELQSRIVHSGLMTQDASSDEELDNMFQLIRRTYLIRRSRPQFEIPDRELTGPKWRRFVEIMVVLYWTDIERFSDFGSHDPLALFCSKQGFINLIDIMDDYVVSSRLEVSEG